MTDIDKILEDVERLGSRALFFNATAADSESIRALCAHSVALASEVRRLRADNERLRLACSKVNDEICQTLGKALGYPWFKDDQDNFPGATEANGVCVGDHVAESLADESARQIVTTRDNLDAKGTEIANMRGQLVKAADKITFERRKLVEAAIEIARISWLEYGVEPAKCIDLVKKKYGIRLKFEDGEFLEDKS